MKQTQLELAHELAEEMHSLDDCGEVTGILILDALACMGLELAPATTNHYLEAIVDSLGIKGSGLHLEETEEECNTRHLAILDAFSEKS